MQGLPDVLTLGDLSVVYQPIVSLATMEPFAHEALVRSNSPHWINPAKALRRGDPVSMRRRPRARHSRALHDALPRDAPLSQRASE